MIRWSKGTQFKVDFTKGVKTMKTILPNTKISEVKFQEICGEFVDNEVISFKLNLKKVHEWWKVSTHLAKMLSDRNEHILMNGSDYYWGRTTSGQAIKMDPVIRNIITDTQLIIPGKE